MSVYAGLNLPKANAIRVVGLAEVRGEALSKARKLLNGHMNSNERQEANKIMRRLKYTTKFRGLSYSDLVEVDVPIASCKIDNADAVDLYEAYTELSSK